MRVFFNSTRRLMEKRREAYTSAKVAKVRPRPRLSRSMRRALKMIFAPRNAHLFTKAALIRALAHIKIEGHDESP